VSPSLFYPNHRIGAEPVVGVHNIEPADEILDLEKPVNKGPAQIIDVLDKIAMLLIETAVIMNAAYTIVCGLSWCSAGKKMHLIAFSR
jgi:hypothetical protein